MIKYLQQYSILKKQQNNAHKLQKQQIRICHTNNILKQSQINDVESILSSSRIQNILQYKLHFHMADNKAANAQVELSSQSDAEDIDIDDLNDIRVDPSDLDQLNQLFATTKITVDPKLDRIDTKSPITVSLDSFLRNFFIRNKMTETLQNFQQEWYFFQQVKGNVQNAIEIPQEYIQSQRLREQSRKKRDELDKAIIMAEKARGTYDKLLKERNFYKMHHQRVQQEKKKLNMELEKLRNQHLSEQKKYDEMADKYSNLMKQKMMIKLQRDRLKTRAQIQKQMNQTSQQQEQANPQQQQKSEKFQKINKTTTSIKYTAFPPDDRVNPYSQEQIKPFDYKNNVLYKTFKGHDMSVNGLALHPKKPIIATVSDDLSWKLWSVPQGELIMSGEGHKGWVSSIKFHPKGLHIVTCSGDSTIKVWDFLNTACTQTLKDHTQAVWDIDIHDMGDFIASASMDHYAKIFDLNVGKCRHSLRGHVDSVNSIRFQPYSNIISTGSADKTVTLWDMRTSLPIQVLYGHANSVNCVGFNLVGDKIVSCDSDGMVKVWDVRMVKEKDNIDFSQYSANTVGFDGSGNFVAAGLDNGQIKLYNLDQAKFDAVLKGHDDAVQDLIFDLKSKAIYSCGSDSTFRIWQ